MTWIVGTAPPFGYAILVSDICVRFTRGDGRYEYHDCLQKIYPLGPAIIGGFAGSVNIGFSMLGNLQQILSRVPLGSGWSLNVIGHTWLPRFARRIFNSAPERERALGVSLILASVHPILTCGDAPWPQTDVYTFRYPSFEPLRAGSFEVVSIGSGSAVPVYVEALRNLSGIASSFLRTATMGEKGQARLLAHIISESVDELRTPGISTLFQVGVVNNRQCTIANHEYTVYDTDGTQQEVRFPQIAQNYREFQELCQEINCQAEEVIASERSVSTTS